ncbi:NFX1-type zinc finger-containing protein 1 [Symbiodinium microadriaticum]|uniref:NFX1-type zinc finger-containing protein 1 n=1 Tax=Symbiodinium microadriaticum TaxID=2951 RepID=A0A1Q9C3J6_SYMMI|nr:NFX1-type zinc finger-containing protein 1 [Symbiodinium microadriaticum]
MGGSGKSKGKGTKGSKGKSNASKGAGGGGGQGYRNHNGYSYNGWSGASGSGSWWSSSRRSANVDDSRRFVQKLSHAKGDLGKQILDARDQWQQCWSSCAVLPSEAVKSLVTILCKIPPSASPPPPPAGACQATMRLFLEEEKKGSPESAVAAVEVVINAVRKLLTLEWDVSVEEVRESLQNILEDAHGCLQIRHKDHKEAARRITLLVDELEKPWCIKIKPTAGNEEGAEERIGKGEDEESSGISGSWRRATVGWLARLESFCPFTLPKMQTSKSKQRGIYATPEEYMDTIEKLMVGMTFSDGNAAISPRCWMKDCGSTLWPIPESMGLHCRTRGCARPVVLACSNSKHDSGMCKKCAADATQQLMGRKGHRASTHVYDCVLSRVGFDGRLYFEGLESRCPPQMKIHWRTTRRLQSPNLVALVRLSEPGAALKASDPIYWGEVSHHPPHGGKPQDEARNREHGYIAINVSSITGFDDDVFTEGDHAAIIDCMTFVPEYIPVLKALENQRMGNMPFEGGALLNLCSWHRPDLGGLLDASADLSNYRLLVASMVEESSLPPIMAVRRDPVLSEKMCEDLVALLKEATLDEGQLRSFIDGLKSPVHLTQGPPGTGKSYLGVVMVRALMIVRKFWVKVDESVGTPPILVLSYKNHAIDEFLLDLIKADSRLGRGTGLIRIGGGASLDQRLVAFSEKTLGRQDWEVQGLKRTVQWLHDLSSACKALCSRAKSFGGFQADMFAQHPNDDPTVAQKKRNKCAYEATEMLLASLVRIFRLTKAKHREEAGHFGEDDGDSDSGFLTQVDFLREDVHDARSRRMQTSLSRSQIFFEVPHLEAGVAHYVELGHTELEDPSEVLYMFLRGDRPLPMCKYGGECESLAYSHDADFCVHHSCWVESDDGTCCRNPVLPQRWACAEHACQVESCERRKLPAPQRFCEDHACKKCLSLGKISPLAGDDPPRNVCMEHPLCYQCHEFALPGKDVCESHDVKQCQYTSWWGRSCSNPSIPGYNYCSRHMQSYSYYDGSAVDEARAEGSDGAYEKAQSLRAKSSLYCAGVNRKGKKCQAMAMPGSQFCHAHAPAELHAASFVQDVAKESKEAEARTAQQEGGPPADEEQALDGADNDLHEDVEFASAAGQSDVLPQEAEGRYDNQDEVEEADNLQHLREVYDVDGFSEESSEGQGPGSEELAAEDAEDLGPEDPESPHLLDSKEWTWELNLEQRWAACESLMTRQNRLLLELVERIRKQIYLKRRRLHEAEVRASARVYENKSVIGGTIVGCISRLEAIRSTNPFAIVVEEASEVLEPLLFSCFCQSTLKLEMIGDHLQLQPSIMQKFAFERVNSVNVSMFERLIRAPEDHRVPSAVLKTQRRMRSHICDLTREYYESIVAIEDHEVCSTRRIPGSLAKQSAGKGREVPGVQSNIFLWTHSGSQGKADVGMSKVNRQEADMAVWLAYYLVQCGVPKTSIVILTPYKGQLMLMRKLLFADQSEEKLLSRDWDNTDQIRLSTVDRFQGDEADIVIASLVVDEHSRTPFVKLVNRMIVLLSRARLGMYILGNTGYFENSRQEIKHWQRTFALLQEPASKTDNADPGVAEVFERPRVGSKLPLCCPQHPQSVFDAVKAEELKLGFCGVPCQVRLPCSHPCGLKCHWPQQKHNKKCMAAVPSPCARHEADVTCESVFANSDAGKHETIDEALRTYRCPIKVKVTLPCMHEKEMSCRDEEDIQSGQKSWPQCEEMSHTPYVYPDCRHTMDVKCYMLNEYNAGRSQVPKCEQMVDYVPICEHTARVKCWLKQAYQRSSAAQFVCPVKQDIKLPRCSHAAKVSCAENIQLQSWQGGRCAEQDIVREGVEYGPLDRVCCEKVTFVRRCGHQERVECGRAFDLARIDSHCQEKVSACHPECGHDVHISCYRSRQLEALARPDKPLDELTEGCISPVPVHLADIKCTAQVVIKRACGHQHHIACNLKSSALPPCNESITVRSPLCGHEIQIPCHARATLEKWQPWDEQAMESLTAQGILPAAARPTQAQLDDQLMAAVRGCRQTVKVERPCGHSAEFNCKQLVQFLKQQEVKGHCSVTVEKPLACGHMASATCRKFQDYEQGKATIKCTQKRLTECWNAAACKSKRLTVDCAESRKVCCGKEISWTCEKSHTFRLKICQDGRPSECPSCSEERLSAAMENTASHMDDTSQPLPSLDVFESLAEEMQPTEMPAEMTSRFLAQKQILLSKFQELSGRTPVWQRASFQEKLIPIFHVLEGAAAKEAHKGFAQLGKFRKESTLGGIQVHRLTAANLQSLATEKVKEGTAHLLLGYAYSLSSCSDKWPNKKNKQAPSKWRQQGFDSFEAEDLPGPKRFVVWEPFALYATHHLQVNKPMLNKMVHLLAAESLVDLTPRHISFIKPEGKLVLGTCQAEEGCGEAELFDGATFSVVQELQGSPAEGFSFPATWDGTALAPGELTEGQEKELAKKLSFVNPAAAPFAGKSLLDKLMKEREAPLPLLDLLMALEVYNADGDVARSHLDSYLTSLRASTRQVAHPLLLLVLHRVEGLPILETALHRFPEMEPMLTSDEKTALHANDGKPKDLLGCAQPVVSVHGQGGVGNGDCGRRGWGGV